MGMMIMMIYIMLRNKQSIEFGMIVVLIYTIIIGCFLLVAETETTTTTITQSSSSSSSFNFAGVVLLKEVQGLVFFYHHHHHYKYQYPILLSHRTIPYGRSQKQQTYYYQYSMVKVTHENNYNNDDNIDNNIEKEIVVNSTNTMVTTIAATTESNSNDNTNQRQSLVTKQSQQPQQPQVSRIEAIRQILRQEQDDDETSSSINNDTNNRRNTIINVVTSGLLVAMGISIQQLYMSNIYTPNGFQRLSTIQFIAALGDPNANSGTFHPQQKEWGIWKLDPGPRGVYIRDSDHSFTTENNNNSNSNNNNQYIAPAGWVYNPNDIWIEEHGIIMEEPKFPIPSGHYLVTGGRSITTGIVIDTSIGTWKFDDPTITLYDVTHLPCRSARYQPISSSLSSTISQSSIKDAVIRTSSKNNNKNNFPVLPGAPMPNIDGYTKQDYAVLFLVGIDPTYKKK